MNSQWREGILHDHGIGPSWTKAHLSTSLLNDPLDPLILASQIQILPVLY